VAHARQLKRLEAASMSSAARRRGILPRCWEKRLEAASTTDVLVKLTRMRRWRDSTQHRMLKCIPQTTIHAPSAAATENRKL